MVSRNTKAKKDTAVKGHSLNVCDNDWLQRLLLQATFRELAVFLFLTRHCAITFTEFFFLIRKLFPKFVTENGSYLTQRQQANKFTRRTE
jgi:hypothetical protein